MSCRSCWADLGCPGYPLGSGHLPGRRGDRRHLRRECQPSRLGPSRLHRDFLTLADDSGLEVDALGGAPGVRSARYSTTGSDSDNVDLLLKNLSQVSDEARTARFVCVVAIAGPSEDIEFSRGECEGAIARERRGEGGFGYDPVFLPSGRDVTMAQLPMEEKNYISHRARAVRKAIPLIKRRLEETGP